MAAAAVAVPAVAIVSADELTGGLEESFRRLATTVAAMSKELKVYVSTVRAYLSTHETSPVHTVNLAMYFAKFLAIKNGCPSESTKLSIAQTCKRELLRRKLAHYECEEEPCWDANYSHIHALTARAFNSISDGEDKRLALFQVFDRFLCLSIDSALSDAMGPDFREDDLWKSMMIQWMKIIAAWGKTPCEDIGLTPVDERLFHPFVLTGAFASMTRIIRVINGYTNERDEHSMKISDKALAEFKELKDEWNTRYGEIMGGEVMA